MHTRSAHRGFTLIEMSIVVLIIALIIGGVLLARDIIRGSEIRSVISDVEQIRNAINAFRQKYDYYPGDFPRATSYWGSDGGGCTAYSGTQKSSTCDGDGDNQLDTPGWTDCNTATATYQQEPFRLWQHLANAELFRGQYTGTQGAANKPLHGVVGSNIPKSTKIKEVGYEIMNFEGAEPAGGDEANNWFNDRYYNVMFIGRGDTVPAYSCFEPVLPFLSSLETYNLDVKMDDGRPGSGAIRTFTSTGSNTIFHQPYCATNATTYSMNKNPRSCSLIWMMNNW